MEGVPVQLAYENVACVSNHIRDMLIGQGVVGANIVVIHNGIAIKQFPMRTIADFDNRFLSCLYAGRIEAHKGVHTIVEAVHHLQEQSISDGIHVTLVGDGQPDYISMLKRRIQQLDLEQMITFQPRVTRSEMPRLLAQFDVLLIPSRFEALSRMVQEAMAIGLVVVGTATGGSSELLIDGETGLVFPPEDASALAAQLLRLVDEPDLCHRLAYAGRGAVVEHFTMTRMLDEIVVYLEEVVNRQDTP